jgi:hypothetical protein
MIRILVMCIYIIVFSAPAFAMEAACSALGENCACSEPLNTNSVSRAYPDTNTTTYNPGDTSTKECNRLKFIDHTDGTNGNLVTPTNAASDPTMFSALPAGHSLSYVYKGPTSMPGTYTWYMGFDGINSYPYKRVAARWYIYYSPTYTFQWSSGCDNSKTFFMQPPLSYSESTASWDKIVFYNSDWSSGEPTCCSSGGPNTTAFWGYSESVKQGKWWRYDIAISNLRGGSSPNGFQFTQWVTNVTGGGSPVKVIDTNGTLSRDGDWSYTSKRTPSPQITGIGYFGYRQHGTSNCAGYAAMSHLMVAAWDTDTGQMIGASSEIEGGGGGSPPVGNIVLSVRSFIPIIFAIIGGALAMVCLVMGGVRWWERRRQYALRSQGPLDSPGDSGGQPVEPCPVDGTPPAGQHGVQPVVSVPSADELVGVGAAREISADQGARTRQEAVR